MLNVIAPALWVVELRLICHSFKVADIGPDVLADAAGDEHAASRPAIAMNTTPRRMVADILSSSR
jgi:hypothetical protein